ncbi:hypothetical protein StoSoilB13_29580 (plasmid) [Arthrobacter sp. StoSoilB13]|nr:hypothetical protein StoSoilB13_29580 [Arthrobacter sp. StoSoilB13]
MGADAYAAANAFSNSGGHDVGITGVEPACDIGACNDLQELGIVANGVGAESLSKIRYKINCRVHVVLFPWFCIQVQEGHK